MNPIIIFTLFMLLYQEGNHFPNYFDTFKLEQVLDKLNYTVDSLGRINHLNELAHEPLVKGAIAHTIEDSIHTVKPLLREGKMQQQLDTITSLIESMKKLGGLQSMAQNLGPMMNALSSMQSALSGSESENGSGSEYGAQDGDSSSETDSGSGFPFHFGSDDEEGGDSPFSSESEFEASANRAYPPSGAYNGQDTEYGTPSGGGDLSWGDLGGSPGSPSSGPQDGIEPFFKGQATESRRGTREAAPSSRAAGNPPGAYGEGAYTDTPSSPEGPWDTYGPEAGGRNSQLPERRSKGRLRQPAGLWEKPEYAPEPPGRQSEGRRRVRLSPEGTDGFGGPAEPEYTSEYAVEGPELESRFSDSGAAYSENRQQPSRYPQGGRSGRGRQQTSRNSQNSRQSGSRAPSGQNGGPYSGNWQAPPARR